MKTPEKVKSRVIGIIGVGFVLVAAAGAFAQAHKWFDPQEFIPYALVALAGFGLLGLNEPIMKFLNSVKSFDAFGIKLDAQEKELNDQKASIQQLTTQIATLVSVQQTLLQQAMTQNSQARAAVNQTIQLPTITVPQIPTELLARLAQQAQINSPEDTIIKPEMTKQNIITSQPEIKKDIYRPKYLEKGINK